MENKEKTCLNKNYCISQIWTYREKLRLQNKISTMQQRTPSIQINKSNKSKVKNPANWFWTSETLPMVSPFNPKIIPEWEKSWFLSKNCYFIVVSPQFYTGYKISCIWPHIIRAQFEPKVCTTMGKKMVSLQKRRNSFYGCIATTLHRMWN